MLPFQGFTFRLGSRQSLRAQHHLPARQRIEIEIIRVSDRKMFSSESAGFEKFWEKLSSRCALSRRKMVQSPLGRTISARFPSAPYRSEASKELEAFHLLLRFRS
jgi:hypothetical protein